MLTKEELVKRVHELRKEKKRLEKEHENMLDQFRKHTIAWDELKPSFDAFNRTNVLLAETELEMKKAWR